MNRTIKDVTVKVYHYDDLENLKAHILPFVAAYIFAKHLKALQWGTPYQVICDAWTKDPALRCAATVWAWRRRPPCLSGFCRRSCRRRVCGMTGSPPWSTTTSCGRSA
ncbi:hypothetical protein MPLDJ20_220002 [Mesorhizobium plurifarium]|uniref:Uncharacterized protein n=1 Tax=Mesorhizobium plurifarium TaxID=69974 RepID=A0A090F288_MESPL|nr:hypothetical protein MPLDJ20_220002 [Mesorhizobium plurifarium]